METCSICLEPFGENITITNCNHRFCNLCFEELMYNNKINCPLCRATITKYSNNDEKVRVLIIENRETPPVDLTNGDLNVRLITRNEIRRYNMRNYFYSLLIIYISYSYMNCTSMVNTLHIRYNNCASINANITETYDGMFSNMVHVTLYNFEMNKLSNVCMIPLYFFNKCFNL